MKIDGINANKTLNTKRVQVISKITNKILCTGTYLEGTDIPEFQFKLLHKNELLFFIKKDVYIKILTK